MRKWRMFSKAQQLKRAFSISQSLEVSIKKVGACEYYMYSNDIVATSFSANKTVLAENYFFPSNFTDVALPDAKVAVADFKLTPDYNIIMVSLIINLVT